MPVKIQHIDYRIGKTNLSDSSEDILYFLPPANKGAKLEITKDPACNNQVWISPLDGDVIIDEEGLVSELLEWVLIPDDRKRTLESDARHTWHLKVS